MNFKEIEFVSNGLKLYGKLYLSNKEKPTIILLHGLGFHSFEYDRFAPLILEGGYNCLAFDFRCCGKSEGRKGYWTLNEYTEDIKSATGYVRQNINNSIILYGNSLGADAAISFAAKYPAENIKAIIAVNCATKPTDFVLTPFRKFLFLLASLFRVFPFRINVNHFIPYKLIIDTPEKIKEVTNDELVSAARSFAFSTYKDIFSWNMTEKVSNVTVPILIIQGKNDRLQPISQATTLYDAANQPKELMLIDAGHLPNIDKPEYLSRLILNWLYQKQLNP